MYPQLARGICGFEAVMEKSDAVEFQQPRTATDFVPNTCPRAANFGSNACAGRYGQVAFETFHFRANSGRLTIGVLSYGTR
jgi:hypothetical protein